jgi:hypothetical protein
MRLERCGRLPPALLSFGIRLAGVRLLLPKQQFNAICRPRRHTGAEKVRVFRPNRTFERQCRCQYRPIFFITFLQALPRWYFEWREDFAIDEADQNRQLSEHRDSGFRVNTRLSRIPGRCSRASAKAVSGAKNRTLAECASRISRTRLPRTARISTFASRITISGADLPAATACFLEIVHQFVFSGSTCREERVELCRGCP